MDLFWIHRPKIENGNSNSTVFQHSNSNSSIQVFGGAASECIERASQIASPLPSQIPSQIAATVAAAATAPQRLQQSRSTSRHQQPLHATPPLVYTMFEARLLQGSLLKKILDGMKDLVTQANFDCSR
jgi:hypothetical protein